MASTNCTRLKGSPCHGLCLLISYQFHPQFCIMVTALVGPRVPMTGSIVCLLPSTTNLLSIDSRPSPRYLKARYMADNPTSCDRVILVNFELKNKNKNKHSSNAFWPKTSVGSAVWTSALSEIELLQNSFSSLWKCSCPKTKQKSLI